MSRRRVNPGALEAMNAGIEKANKRAAGEFDGLNGSLDPNAAALLRDILVYLRYYLLEERGFTSERVRHLCAVALPPLHAKGGGPRSVPQELDDEGVRVAIGLLNSIASVLRLRDKQVVRLLLSGKDGVRGAKVREGGGHRGADTREDRQRRVREMRQMVEKIARENPNRPFRDIASQVASEFGCDERTVRRNVPDPRPKRGRGKTE